MDIDSGHSNPFPEEPDKFRHAPVLGQNVMRLRKQARINKKRFALMVKIGRPFLNKIENGTANPRLDVITRMADALGVEVAELLLEPREEEASTSSPSGFDRHLDVRLPETRHTRLY